MNGQTPSPEQNNSTVSEVAATPAAVCPAPAAICAPVPHRARPQPRPFGHDGSAGRILRGALRGGGEGSGTRDGAGRAFRGINPIIAARAAHELREFDKRDTYLAVAEGKSVGEPTMRLMAQTKFNLDQHQPQAAFNSLKELREAGVIPFPDQ